MNQTFAILAQLEGIPRRIAEQAWQLLAQKNIHFISKRSPCPHITFALVGTEDRHQIIDITRQIAQKSGPLAIQGNGLGIYVADTPVLHMRWIVNEQLLNLKNTIESELKSHELWTSASHYEHDWQAKTTLAYKDIDYHQLPDVLDRLKPLDFRQALKIESLWIYHYDPDVGETPICEISL